MLQKPKSSVKFSDKHVSAGFSTKSLKIRPKKKVSSIKSCSPKKSVFRKKHLCKFCSKTFSSGSKLKRHCLIHTGKPYACQFCGIKFTENSTKNRHELETHMDLYLYSCVGCKQAFKHNAQVQNHMAKCKFVKKQQGDMKEKCEYCCCLLSTSGILCHYNLCQKAQKATGSMIGQFSEDTETCEMCGLAFVRSFFSKHKACCIGKLNAKENEISSSKCRTEEDEQKNLVVELKSEKHKSLPKKQTPKSDPFSSKKVRVKNKACKKTAPSDTKLKDGMVKNKKNATSIQNVGLPIDLSLEQNAATKQTFEYRTSEISSSPQKPTVIPPHDQTFATTSTNTLSVAKKKTLTPVRPCSTMNQMNIVNPTSQTTSVPSSFSPTILSRTQSRDVKRVSARHADNNLGKDITLHVTIPNNTDVTPISTGTLKEATPGNNLHSLAKTQLATANNGHLPSPTSPSNVSNISPKNESRVPTSPVYENSSMLLKQLTQVHQLNVELLSKDSLKPVPPVNSNTTDDPLPVDKHVTTFLCTVCELSFTDMPLYAAHLLSHHDESMKTQAIATSADSVNSILEVTDNFVNPTKYLNSTSELSSVNMYGNGYLIAHRNISNMTSPPLTSQRAAPIATQHEPLSIGLDMITPIGTDLQLDTASKPVVHTQNMNIQLAQHKIPKSHPPPSLSPLNNSKKSHLKMINVEKTFVCNECGKRFVYECNLKRHVLEHEKPQLSPVLSSIRTVCNGGSDGRFNGNQSPQLSSSSTSSPHPPDVNPFGAPASHSTVLPALPICLPQQTLSSSIPLPPLSSPMPLVSSPLTIFTSVPTTNFKITSTGSVAVASSSTLNKDGTGTSIPRQNSFDEQLSAIDDFINNRNILIRQPNSMDNSSVPMTNYQLNCLPAMTLHSTDLMSTLSTAHTLTQPIQPTHMEQLTPLAPGQTSMIPIGKPTPSSSVQSIPVSTSKSPSHVPMTTSSSVSPMPGNLLSISNHIVQSISESPSPNNSPLYQNNRHTYHNQSSTALCPCETMPLPHTLEDAGGACAKAIKTSLPSTKPAVSTTPPKNLNNNNVKLATQAEVDEMLYGPQGK